MIVIFTIQFDFSSSNVIKWLNFWDVPVLRINMDNCQYEFLEISDSGIFLKHKESGDVINLKDIKACWWRKGSISKNIFKKYDSSLSIEGDDFFHIMKRIFSKEQDTIIDYVKDFLLENCPIQIGNPFLGDLNRLKVLDLAKLHGLKTPKFRIVSNTDQIYDQEEKRQVSKAISEGIYNTVNGKRYYTYTELLDSDFPYTNSSVSLFPSLIMDVIEKDVEIRAFYLDGLFYSMCIFSQSSEQTKIDFRKYNYLKPNREIPFLLPLEIETKLRKVFKDLKLNTGSVDLIIDKNGEYVFLEINPSGQYDMVSRPCNYNLDKHIAKYLVNGRHEFNESGED